MATAQLIYWDRSHTETSIELDIPWWISTGQLRGYTQRTFMSICLDEQSLFSEEPASNSTRDVSQDPQRASLRFHAVGQPRAFWKLASVSLYIRSLSSAPSFKSFTIILLAHQWTTTWPKIATDRGWVSQTDGRGILDITWTYVLTVFLSSWTSMCNIIRSCYRRTIGLTSRYFQPCFPRKFWDRNFLILL